MPRTPRQHLIRLHEQAINDIARAIVNVGQIAKRFADAGREEDLECYLTVMRTLDAVGTQLGEIKDMT